MAEHWHHIYPSPISLQPIKKGTFILKFANTDSEDINLHQHNRPSYVATAINKNFVDTIYLVDEILETGLQLKDIKQEIEILVLKEELENGLFYFSATTKLNELLPFNWE